MPSLIAYDVCGVQPMTGPTGLIFAMKARYASQSQEQKLCSTKPIQRSAMQKAGGAAVQTGTAVVAAITTSKLFCPTWYDNSYC